MRAFGWPTPKSEPAPLETLVRSPGCLPEIGSHSNGFGAFGAKMRYIWLTTVRFYQRISPAADEAAMLAPGQAAAGRAPPAVRGLYAEFACLSTAGTAVRSLCRAEKSCFLTATGFMPMMFAISSTG
jgi:hypothetical protein